MKAAIFSQSSVYYGIQELIQMPSAGDYLVIDYQQELVHLKIHQVHWTPTKPNADAELIVIEQGAMLNPASINAKITDFSLDRFKNDS